VFHRLTQCQVRGEGKRGDEVERAGRRWWRLPVRSGHAANVT
jgi:hypothetical protein